MSSPRQPPRRDLARAVRGAWRSRPARLAVGLAISIAFLALTMARVDLRETAAALANAAPAGILVAILLVLLELVIRAERWHYLLAPSRVVPRRLTFAYLNIGYFANALLPARLGDGARAYLAGRAFDLSPLVTLGSIIVERVFDAVAILGVVVVAGLVVARGSEIAGSAAVLAAAVTVGLAVAVVAAIVVHRMGVFDRRWGRLVREVLARIAEGGAALRARRGTATVLALTLIAFGVAICAFGAIATAVGLPLGFAEWALVLGVLALSTAIPAAPGSLGTYEFVGVAALGILGADPSEALAATILVHVIATLPPALLGLAATLVLHVRVSDLEGASRVPMGALGDA